MMRCLCFRVCVCVWVGMCGKCAKLSPDNSGFHNSGGCHVWSFNSNLTLDRRRRTWPTWSLWIVFSPFFIQQFAFRASDVNIIKIEKINNGLVNTHTHTHTHKFTYHSRPKKRDSLTRSVFEYHLNIWWILPTSKNNQIEKRRFPFFLTLGYQHRCCCFCWCWPTQKRVGTPESIRFCCWCCWYQKLHLVLYVVACLLGERIIGTEKDVLSLSSFWQVTCDVRKEKQAQGT